MEEDLVHEQRERGKGIVSATRKQIRYSKEGGRYGVAHEPFDAEG